MDFSQHDRRLTAAQDAWRRAAEAGPGRRDCGFYLGVAQARLDRERPQQVEAAFDPMWLGLADRPLKAEILYALGEAYWQAGQFVEARRRFAASYDVFSL